VRMPPFPSGLRAAAACSVLVSDLPSWIDRLLEPAKPRRASPLSHGVLETTSGTEWSFLSATIPGAVALGRGEFERVVCETYLSLAEAVGRLQQHPVRFWNFVPDLNAAVGPGLDRYMLFNIGRHEACVQWMGSAAGFDQRLATASAVGVQGPDLQVHCLTSAAPGVPVDNPRQVAPFRYSAQFGPRPPCFARATRVSTASAERLLVGGTASIVGEASMHHGDVEAQTHETLNNLEALIATAAGASASPLRRLTSARIYVRHAPHAATVRQIVHSRGGSELAVECRVAQICRRELLVEIEAVADLAQDLSGAE
jgi:enamine deaminase RidA (YjgF/YER057c/UK114 family)